MTTSQGAGSVNRSRPKVVVVGAGVSGLAAALELAADPALDVVVLEASAEAGGHLRGGELAGVPIDVGAESVLATRPEGLGMIRSVGLGSRVVYPEKLVGGLFVDGRMHDLPRGLVVGIPADLRSLAASGVLPLPDLLQLPLDRIRPATPGLAGGADDVSIGELVASRLGPEVVNRLVEPLVASVYAGRADDLSLDMAVPTVARRMRRERSLLAAAKEVNGARVAGTPQGRPAFAGLRGGLFRLVPSAVEALAEQGAKLRLATAVESMSRRGGKWELAVRRPRGVQRLIADAVVLAVPTPVAADLLRPSLPFAASTLRHVRYASTGVVTLAVPDSSPIASMARGRHSGFLAAPSSGLAFNQVTFTSQKWAWMHAKFSDQVVIRAAVGRVGNEAVLELDDAELAELVTDDLGVVIGNPVGRVSAFDVQRWPDALPQYAPGYRARIARVQEQAAGLGGLALCGAAYDGVGVAACVASGRSAARAVRSELEALQLAVEA